MRPGTRPPLQRAGQVPDLFGTQMWPSRGSLGHLQLGVTQNLSDLGGGCASGIPWVSLRACERQRWQDAELAERAVVGSKCSRASGSRGVLGPSLGRQACLVAPRESFGSRGAAYFSSPPKDSGSYSLHFLLRVAGVPSVVSI